MTSSDVLDTALALQLDRGSRLIAEGWTSCGGGAGAGGAVAALPMIGRTHGIHAEPITLGLVFAGWYAELGRAQRRFAAAWTR